MAAQQRQKVILNGFDNKIKTEGIREIHEDRSRLQRESLDVVLVDCV